MTKHIVIDGRIINSTTGRYVERLVTHLQAVDTKNKYTIIVPTKDKDFWVPTSQNFTIHTADIANYSFAEQTRFKNILDELNPDLVHFCMPQQPLVYKGKTVTTFHDLTLLKTVMSDKNQLVYRLKQYVGYFAYKAFIKKTNHIITDTFYTQKALEKFSKKAIGKTTTIHLASDIVEGSVEKYPTKFKQYIMYVGQQADYKNIRRLASAHQRLIKKYPDLGLILVGKKDAIALSNQEYFNRKEYSNIHFTGFVSDSQLNWLYANADAYVFPSLMEGFGLPGLEAMGHGTPVISSNATCLPEVYGDAAHYFDPISITDMARAIDEVLCDDNLRKELIKKGYSQIKKYSWERMAEQTHDVYLKALGLEDRS